MGQNLASNDDCCHLRSCISPYFEADTCYDIVVCGYSSREGSYTIQAQCPSFEPVPIVDTHTFDVALRGPCNVSEHYADDDSYVVHSMTLVPLPGTLIPLGGSPMGATYTCSCITPLIGMVDSNVKAEDGPVRGGTGLGTFTPVLRVYANQPGFQQSLVEAGGDFPAWADLIDLHVVSDSTDYNIGWLNCTASPTNSVDDPYAVPLIMDSCPVEPVSPVVGELTHIARLSMEPFKFTGSSAVYFICWVEGCDPSATCGHCDARRLGDAERRLGDAESSPSDAMSTSSWLLLPADVDKLLPGPIPANRATPIWESLEAPPRDSVASSITLYGCTADATQPAFRNAVTAAIAAQLSVEESKVQLTRVALAQTDSRRLQSAFLDGDLPAIIIDYLLLGGTEQILTSGDLEGFMHALDSELVNRDLGRMEGGSAVFAPVEESGGDGDETTGNESSAGGNPGQEKESGGDASEADAVNKTNDDRSGGGDASNTSLGNDGDVHGPDAKEAAPLMLIAFSGVGGLALICCFVGTLLFLRRLLHKTAGSLDRPAHATSSVNPRPATLGDRPDELRVGEAQAGGAEDLGSTVEAQDLQDGMPAV